MRIEAFSEGKYLDDPEANEDQLLVLPGRGYAVIDGVTDISGRRFDGQRTGRLASRIVQQAAVEFLLDPAAAEGGPEVLIEQTCVALRAAYLRYDMLDDAEARPANRFGATLTLAADLGRVFRFIVIGDSGLRLNGEEVFVVDSGLDLVTATLRQQAYRMVEETGGDLEARRRAGRACAFHGIATPRPEMLPWLEVAGLATLYERSLAQCRSRFPAAPVADIRWLLDHGISGQTRYQNNLASPFSYATLDGFGLPLPLVRVFDRARESVRSIELFTDGYFKTAATPEVTAWEAAFAEVEVRDPEKIDAYPSVKGSLERMRTDDRTVVIVQL